MNYKVFYCGGSNDRLYMV